MKPTQEQILNSLSKLIKSEGKVKVELGSIDELKKESSKVAKMINKLNSSQTEFVKKIEQFKKEEDNLQKLAEEQRNLHDQSEKEIDKAKEVTFAFLRKAKELGINGADIKEYQNLGKEIGVLIDAVEKGYKILKSN